MQEEVAAADAEGRDHHVDRLADRDPALPQQPIVLRARQRQLAAEHVGIGQPIERAARPHEVAVVTEALQHLGDDQVARQQLFASSRSVWGVCRPLK